MSFQSVVIWARRHRVSAHEWMQGGLLIWWAVAIMSTPDRVARTSAFYHQLTAVVPLWVWAATAAGIALVMVLGIVIDNRHVLAASLVLKAAWWLTIAVLTYRSTHTFLAASAFTVISLAAVIRYAELQVDES
jgi:hypothetical protein